MHFVIVVNKSPLDCVATEALPPGWEIKLDLPAGERISGMGLVFIVHDQCTEHELEKSSWSDIGILSRHRCITNGSIVS
jgi:hypothetical protein